jgi:signal transduction histidine kinase/ActR/RegA family two-component response regulator
VTGSPKPSGPTASVPASGLVPSADFQLLFESAPSRYLILDPQLRIVAANDSYLSATMTVRADIMGRNVFEVFPDNPDDPAATGVANLRASLERVCRHRVADTMAVQQYDVERPAEQGGGFEVHYWSVRNSPVLGADQQLVYIVNQVEDVTEFVRLQQHGNHADELTAELRQRTEQMQAEILRRSGELQNANQALRTANDAKNEFLSRVSHELRTPLNAILGFSELLSLEALSTEHHDWVTMILKAGRHLLALLDDVLDIARIEGGHLSMSVEAVPVAALIADSLDLARPLADAGGVHLSPLPAVQADLCVAADRQRLRQVLLNLLSNAIKYNHPAGTVSVTVEQLPEWRVRISVTDTGRGIAAEALGKLFTPFERLDAAQAGFAGTGLGLALSRHLAQSMHGTLDLSSKPGQGSTFWIDLPTAEPTTARRPATEADNLVARRTYATGKRILYVEDMVENVRLVEQILTHRPAVTLIPAMLAGIALDLAREDDLDLILLDLHLPDIPGEEVLRRLRADPTTRDIPVVVLSADATRRHIDQLLSLGAAAYLTKPITVRDLLHTVDELLNDDLAPDPSPTNPPPAGHRPTTPPHTSP